MTARVRIALILLCFIYHGNSQILFSQSSDFIEGNVINEATGKPVPFATIKLITNQLGVYANADGDFKVAQNQDFRNDSLIVTCIGYKQKSVAYKDLSDKTLNKILLTPVIYGLAEVKVVASRSRLSANAIIRRAIRKITNNYPVNPYSYIAYYRDYQKNGNTYLNLNEALVQTLDTGFNSNSFTNKYRLLDFRKNTDFPRMNISPYYDSHDPHDSNNSKKTIPDAWLGDQYGNELFILMVHDPIRNFKKRSFSFVETLEADFLMNHSFSDPVNVFDNNLLLYKIEFVAKHHVSGDSLQISGAIYIQPKDYSIHKLEYTCYYPKTGEELKKMFNIDVEYGWDNSVDSLMCLKYISFNNFFKVTDLDDTTYFKVIGSYLDTLKNLKSTVVLRFNDFIDPVSASRKDNYDISSGGKIIKINHIQVIGKQLFIRLNVKNQTPRQASVEVNIRNVKDLNGNIVNRKRSMELYQYRELFVQEYNKPVALKDSCYMEYLPLERNCISKFNGKENYWMNTPENIKIIK
jgi:hypothetical protein